MNLSKAFDCVSHGLLTAKLNAYGLNLDALQIIRSYLANRKQRIKMNCSYSKWEKIKIGVPQGLVLRPLLYNIFITEIFWFVNHAKICNYADDNLQLSFTCHRDLNTVITQLEEDCSVIVKWFSDNLLKFNDEKCHLMVFGDKSTETRITFRNPKLKGK